MYVNLCTITHYTWYIHTCIPSHSIQYSKYWVHDPCLWKTMCKMAWPSLLQSHYLMNHINDAQLFNMICWDKIFKNIYYFRSQKKMLNLWYKLCYLLYTLFWSFSREIIQKVETARRNVQQKATKTVKKEFSLLLLIYLHSILGSSSFKSEASHTSLVFAIFGKLSFFFNLRDSMCVGIFTIFQTVLSISNF